MHITSSFSLRGHGSQITSLDFNEAQIISGDDQGWIFWWSVITRRPLGIWKAHSRSILTVKWLTRDTVLTHGRDNKLYIYRVTANDNLDVAIPTPTADGSNWKHPWLVYSQDVNALNFCQVAICNTLLAVPATTNPELVDVYIVEAGETLQRPFKAVGPDPASQMKTGIVMAISLNESLLVVGYDSGHVIAYDISSAPTAPIVYCQQLHSQPVLSLTPLDGSGAVISSSVDALLIRHNITSDTFVSCNTKHAGLTSLDVRSDGKLLLTAGWDGRARVFNYATLQMLAVFETEASVARFSRSIQTPEDKCQVSPMDQAVAKPSSTLVRLQEKFLSANWVATGRKSGVISLYKIY